MPGTVSRPIRVLMYEHNVDGTIGGSHFCLLEICKAIDRRHVEPVVVFAQHNPLVKVLMAAGVEVIVISPSGVVRITSQFPMLRPLARVSQSIANAFRTLVVDAIRWRLRLRRLRIDLLYLNNSCGGDHEAVAGALLCGVPVIAHQRGYPQNIGSRERWFVARMRAVIAISESVRTDLVSKRLAPGRIRLIHDGIDPARIEASAASLNPAELRARFGIPVHAPLVGVIGNVKAWKGQDTLVRAMPEILRHHPDAFALIVGSIADDAYHALMLGIIEAHGLAGRVKFVGYQQHPAAFMAAMHVVAHTSTAPEPFGLVVLEGMVLGKPVVASAHGGPLDILEQEVSGYLTPPGNASALADVVARLLSDSNLRERVGAAGRERMHRFFTASRNCRAIEAVIMEAAGGGLPRE